MTRFDVQKGALVGAPSETAVPTAKKSQAFSIARYEAQEKRRKQALARKLLQLVYPNRHLIISGDLCYVQPTVTESGITIPNYMSRLCHHVPADVWEKLPRTDRYAALQLIIPREYRTPVPGGMVYQVRFKSRGIHEEWVFLTVGHDLSRCKLVPQTLAARVF